MATEPSPEWPDLAIADFVLPGSRSARDASRAIKPGRHGLPPEMVASIQRGRLIDAFILVTAEDGFPQVTISRVTDAAGVTKKAFYVHFASLDDCFLAAYEYGSAMLLALMSQAYNAAPTWSDGIRAGLRILLKVLASETPFAKASVVEINAAGPRVREVRSRYLQGFRTFFAQSDDTGRPAIPVSVVDAVVDAVVGGIYSAIYIRVEAGRTDELLDLLPSLTYFALLPILGREEAEQHLSAV
jgi:AcrR family transcriptional regulator